MTDRVVARGERALAIQEERITIPAEGGDVHVRVVKPAGVTGFVPVVLYVHDEARVHDDEAAQERLARDFVVGANTAVVFVGHSPSASEGRSAVIGQAYAAVRWISSQGAANGLDASRLTMARDRLTPSTDAPGAFADGPHISGRAMAWFWAHHSPEGLRDEQPQGGRSRPRSVHLPVVAALLHPTAAA